MRDLNELQVFAAAATEMSFTRAAGKLEISKPAVSRAIAGLETRLSIRLFERTTRRLLLTEAGETYLAYARRAVEEADDADAAVLKLAERPRGTLRIAMPVTLARSSIAPNLAQFLQKYPELRLEITLRGGQIDPIAQRVDVVFQTSKPEADSQIVQRRILKATTGIYASRSYLKNAPELRSPQHLAQHSCLIMAQSRQDALWVLRKEGKIHEVRVRGRVSVGDPVMHQQLCRDGVGIAMMPEWLIRQDVKDKTLVRVLPDWQTNPIELYVLYPTRLSMTPKLNAFLQFAEGTLPGSRL